VSPRSFGVPECAKLANTWDGDVLWILGRLIRDGAFPEPAPEDTKPAIRDADVTWQAHAHAQDMIGGSGGQPQQQQLYAVLQGTQASTPSTVCSGDTQMSTPVLSPLRCCVAPLAQLVPCALRALWCTPHMAALAPALRDAEIPAPTRALVWL